MPSVHEAVKISSRPPWLDPRTPFWKHQFARGNVFLLRMLASHAEPLQANASARQFESIIKQTRGQLCRAVRLWADGKRVRNEVLLQVNVENLAGHKFPTGHPYRRARLHVRVSDHRNRTLFESGATDRSGAIRDVPNSYAPHRDLITHPDEVQIYQAVMADTQGNATWLLLCGAAYLKDNRLPPRGFAPSGTHAAHVAIRGGAELDANFNARGSGRDTVTYRIALPPSAAKLSVEVELLYQSVPPEAVARLLNSSGTEARAFTRLYRRMSNQPELAQRQRLEL